MNDRISHLLGFVLLALAVLPAAAQDWKGRGRLHGVVLDPDENPVAGARVTLLKDGTGPEPFETSAKGRWRYTGLRNGPWTIRIEKDGYRIAEGPAAVAEFGGAGAPIVVTLNPDESVVKKQAGDAIRSTLEEGNRLIGESRYAEARAAYETILSELGEEGRAQVEMAIAGTYLGEGRTEEARTRYRELVLAVPADQRPTVQSQIARTYFEEGEIDLAVSTLEGALALAPDDVEILRLIVDVLLSEGRKADAAPYLERLPEGTTLDPDTLLNLGITAYNDGDLDEAAGLFNDVVDAFPDRADAYYYRGMNRLAREDNDGARADFERLLELDSEHPKAAEAEQFLSYLEKP